MSNPNHESKTMPPRLLHVPIQRSNSPKTLTKSQRCLFCSFSQSLRAPRSRWSRSLESKFGRISTRRQSSVASSLHEDNRTSSSSNDVRSQLRDALNDLQTRAGAFVNISQLQLALRGIDQIPGQEVVRIAIIGLSNNGKTSSKPKQLLRLLLADPLKPEEEWERTLLAEQAGSRPMLVRVSNNTSDDPRQTNRLVQELNISSPAFRNHTVEMLVVEDWASDESDARSLGSLLVPTMNIPTSGGGRWTPVTTPVHKSFVLADGIMGAVGAIGLHIPPGDQDLVCAAVDLPNLDPDTRNGIPLQTLDIDLASRALEKFRKSVDNAIIYEQDWFASGLPAITEWVKSDLSSGTAMQHPLRTLIESVLDSASSQAQAEEERQRNLTLSQKLSPQTLDDARVALTRWSGGAHLELRDQLDVAFDGSRWRKLGWWKLFWRVDDVTMIASDILKQRFLIDTERELIYLSGAMQQAGFFRRTPTYDKMWAYKAVAEKPQSGPPPPTFRSRSKTPEDDSVTNLQPRTWPIDILASRTFLVTETVPALQALAQKLVLQTLTTSTFTSLLAGLVYVSTISTSLYEAGAVAAVGIVYGLRRLQGKWERARTFWEEEVREEGRKAVKSTETQMAEGFNESGVPVSPTPELEAAKDAIQKARAALKSLE